MTTGPYHHGSLREALLEAAEHILVRDGIQALTLRATAREAGVSHAAPKNHFDDLAGLLSALAAVGFERFRAAMLAEAATETTPAGRMDAIGRAYVHFADANRGLFLLMFRGERLQLDRPPLSEAAGAAFAVLAATVAESRPETPAGPPTLDVAGQMVTAWSLVHGFSMLLIDGRLDPILEQLPKGAGWPELLETIVVWRRAR
jgi:AcrR family transcriptional regulator